MLRALRAAAGAIALTLLLASHARANLPEISVPPLVATSMVRGYFEALRRQDRPALEAFTVGEALRSTDQMLDKLREEARRRRVGVELKLKDLAVEAAGRDEVEARFDIAVVAHKWLMTLVAHELHGKATFYFGKSLARGDGSGAKIVGIKLNLD